MTSDGGRDILRELYKHHLWANLALLDLCERQSDDTLDLSVTGMYGTPRQTLVHLLAAEERYVAIFTGEGPNPPLGERDGFPGFALLRERAQQSGAALEDIAANLDPAATFESSYGGQDWRVRSLVVLIQAINHGTEHREQIKVALSQAGVEVPDVDGWTYGGQVGFMQPGG